VEKVRKVFWLAAIMLVLAALISGGCSKSVPSLYLPPVSSVLPAEHTTDFPKNLRWLTDEEKTKITEIALSTDAAKEWLQKESQYKTGIDWIALFPDHEGEGYDGYTRFEYDIVEKGIPRGTVDMTPPGSSQKIVSIGVPEDAEIYPDVTIWFGMKWVVSVAVDVETGKVVFDEDYPNLSNPDRFPGLTDGK
jgi:hypothetical protein